jgi:hypothetical protein
MKLMKSLSDKLPEGKLQFKGHSFACIVGSSEVVHKIRSEKESLLQSAGCQLKDVK